MIMRTRRRRPGRVGGLVGLAMIMSNGAGLGPAPLLMIMK